jgi:hypothetical protein
MDGAVSRTSQFDCVESAQDCEADAKYRSLNRISSILLAIAEDQLAITFQPCRSTQCYLVCFSETGILKR